MKKSNFALRLQPSLIEEAREIAKAEGVALNQFINVAVAEKVAAIRARAWIADRARSANLPQALEILQRAGSGNPPMEGDELPSHVRIDSRMNVRIDVRRTFLIEQPVHAYKDTEEGSPLIPSDLAAGQIVHADPDYWKGIRWNGFEVVKFTFGPEWLCARREEFLSAARPVKDTQAISA